MAGLIILVIMLLVIMLALQRTCSINRHSTHPTRVQFQAVLWNSLHVLEHSCGALCPGHDCPHYFLLQRSNPTGILEPTLISPSAGCEAAQQLGIIKLNFVG